MSSPRVENKGLGTAPVFFAAIGTILGAIMFLRMGYAVANVGLLGTFLIIILGHMVTIPTAMAIAEIATNEKVEGGGEYFIVSRSFGLTIGASLGVGLYISQAISVSFYLIAFAQAFEPVFAWLRELSGLPIHDLRLISVPSLVILGSLIYFRGAAMGTSMLYVIVAILFAALALFFAGSTDHKPVASFYKVTIEKPEAFFLVFAVIFPAFTGMTMGVGLSGDLKNPRKAIPIGTIAATLCGLVLYCLIAWKLAVSSSAKELNEDQLIMSKIAFWGPAVLIGLGSAALSSALSSLMVAPRTLQALARDGVLFSGRFNAFLRGPRTGSDEPRGALIPTLLIAFVFVAIGDVNIVAGIITMFFMVIYGALCLVSFLNHFASDPSYRPAFRSRWYISLLGAACCTYLMFRISPVYALIALASMIVIYFLVRRADESHGMAALFEDALQQIVNRLRIVIQKIRKKPGTRRWRPSVICLSSNSFQRYDALDLLRWISHRHGFATYIHLLNGYLSRTNAKRADKALARLVEVGQQSASNVYFSSMVSPSYTSAIAQVLQLPGVSGRPNNTILFEYNRRKPEQLAAMAENFRLTKTRDFDTMLLACAPRKFGYRNRIDVWITESDFANMELMILLSHVILGHPDWAKGVIRICAVFPGSKLKERRAELREMIESGRLPVSPRNLNLIAHRDEVSLQSLVNEHSAQADLTLLGFRGESLAREKQFELFQGYPDVGNILFVNTMVKKTIS